MDQAYQSKSPQTADPATDTLEYHNEREFHLAESKLGSRGSRLAGMGKSFLAACKDTSLH